MIFTTRRTAETLIGSTAEDVKTEDLGDSKNVHVITLTRKVHDC